MPVPSIAEIRAVCCPAGLLDRRNGEHWAGRWYMRRLSSHVTRLLVTTTIRPNTLTGSMIVVGLAAALVLAVLPGLLGALVAVFAIQLYLLLDCVDGEVARWRAQTTVTGMYLDRIGHYLVEAALLVGVGFHASGNVPDGFAVLGCLAAIGAVLIKAETDLVDVTRARNGLPPVVDSAARPRSDVVAKVRHVASIFNVHRLIGAVETSLFVLVAAIFDTAFEGLMAGRAVVVVLATIAGIMVIAHLTSILTSSRLR